MPRRCREIMRNSPTALRVLKAALNAAEDGQAGIQASIGIPSVVLSCLSMRLHVIFEMSGCESHRQVLYRRSWAGMPRCCSTSQRRATRQVLLHPCLRGLNSSIALTVRGATVRNTAI